MWIKNPRFGDEALPFLPRYKTLTHDNSAAIFLSYLWNKFVHSGRDRTEFELTRSEIETDTGLSRDEQESARRRLKKLNVLREKPNGQSGLIYEIDVRMIGELLHGDKVEKTLNADRVSGFREIGPIMREAYDRRKRQRKSL
jgi:hypothetical protein